MDQEKESKRNVFYMSYGERMIFIICLVITCLIVILGSGYTVIRSMGKTSLKKHADNVVQQTEEVETERYLQTEEPETALELREGQVLHKGKVYEYNPDVMALLCMGVDASKGITDSKLPGTAGQADTLMLVVLEPHRKDIQILALNRDTMAQIELYDTDGNYNSLEWAQITLQYAYGDGREQSCERMEQAVSRFLYDIPIHGYITVDMKAIPVINDLVGGVEVTMPEDLTKSHREWKKGYTTLLEGDEALDFVRYRDTSWEVTGSNLNRISRQKQFLTGFLDKLKEHTKENIRFPLMAYSQVKPHTITSLSLREITYLASIGLEYNFSPENIITIPGEYKMGEEFEEFYPDEEVLRETVIDLFYEEVPQK